jgi:hypothetical protein
MLGFQRRPVFMSEPGEMQRPNQFGIGFASKHEPMDAAENGPEWNGEWLLLLLSHSTLLAVVAERARNGPFRHARNFGTLSQSGIRTLQATWT